MADNNKSNEPSSSAIEPVAEDEEVVNLADVLKAQDEAMEEVAAVLGAGDEINCSYNQGYMKRQALYACLTCVPQGKEDFKKSAGFCLACAYHCHDGHNLIELYTKRHFRCDCGNNKFGGETCNLNPNKDNFNAENEYNQNFCGVYCTCHKMYPDPEDPIEDVMIQCIICEDWYHSRHLNTSLVDDFAEMICEACVTTHSFLMNYVGMAMTKVEKVKTDEVVNVLNVSTTTEEKTDLSETSIENQNGDVVNDDKEKTENIVENKQEIKINESEVITEKTGGEDATNNTPKQADTIDEIKPSQTEEKTLDNEEKPTKSGENNVSESSNCIKPKIIDESQPKTLFMKELKWRNALCKCDACLKIYKEQKVEYLLDAEDTVECYEKKGKENYNDAKKRAMEKEQEILKSMPRAPLLDAIQGFNEFKGQLADYLKKFAEENKVLTVDDVKEFFSKLNSNKRQKTSEGTYFCR